MIDFNMPTYEANTKLLLQGMWYSDLPDILDLDELANYLDDAIRAIDNHTIPTYKQDQDGFIVDWKNITSPSYISNEFKAN